MTPLVGFLIQNGCSVYSIMKALKSSVNYKKKIKKQFLNIGLFF